MLQNEADISLKDDVRKEKEQKKKKMLERAGGGTVDVAVSFASAAPAPPSQSSSLFTVWAALPALFSCFLFAPFGNRQGGLHSILRRLQAAQKLCACFLQMGRSFPLLHAWLIRVCVRACIRSNLALVFSMVGCNLVFCLFPGR